MNGRRRAVGEESGPVLPARVGFSSLTMKPPPLVLLVLALAGAAAAAIVRPP
jgi:hypothetical protein